MKPDNIVNINADFQRSVNINSDFNDLSSIDGYVVTQTSVSILQDVAKHYANSNQHAFTWTGPYGSGKSSLALLLMTILSNKNNQRERIKSQLGDALYTQLYEAFQLEKNNWQCLPITGEKEKIEKIVKSSLKKNGITGRKRSLKLIEEHIQTNKLIIVFDELGKVFEYAGEGNTDIYYFQQLAELANRNRNLIFIGILHQSIAEYARDLPFTLRDEWSKVQGRFIDYVVNAASEEQIHLISKAIIINDNQYIPSNFRKICNNVSDNIRLNKVINKIELASLTYECWPLHPLTTFMLAAFSKQRFGQNQRTVFAFLSSSEREGFMEYISQSFKETNDYLYTPDRFYDYLHYNFASYISSSSVSKLWALGEDAIARAQISSLADDAVKLLKTICLIDIFKQTSGITATYNLLSSITNINNLEDVLSYCQKNALILYRKHLNTFSLFEGSDFDIEGAIKEAINKTKTVDFTHKLNSIVNLAPVIAKRHYHQTGSIRWFNFVITQNLDSLSKHNYDHNHIGDFILFIPSSKKQANESNPADIFNSPKRVYTQLTNANLFNEYLQEIKALEWIQSNDSRLLGDSVARREVENRIYFITQRLINGIEADIKSATWYYLGNPIEVNFNRMSVIVSQVADKLFPYTPKIQSELLNREKPSASANSAKSALIRAIFTGYGLERLGIDGYPAEGGLYDAIIDAHSLYDGENFVEPEANDSLVPLWQYTDNFLMESDRNVALPEVYKIWSDKLGVKSGLHSLLASIYIFSRRSTVATYIEGVYQVEYTDYLGDFITRTPKYIELRAVSNNTDNTVYLNALLECIQTIVPGSSSLGNDKATALYVAQYLVKFLDSLNKWVLRTKTLSSTTRLVRERLKTASDPNRLLYDDIPGIFEGTISNIDYWQEDFLNSLKELKDAYPNLIQSFAQYLSELFQIQLFKQDAFANLINTAAELKNRSGNVRLDGFITRLSRLDPEDITSIDSLISFAINKPVYNWIDSDIEKAKVNLIELVNEFNRLDRLLNHKPNHSQQASLIVNTTTTESKVIDINLSESNESPQVQTILDTLHALEGVDSETIKEALVKLCINEVSQKEKNDVG